MDLGEYGPIILYGIKILLLRERWRFTLYIIGNIIVNTLLKLVIHENRPVETDAYGVLQRYGMPSGHAQLSLFMLFYKWRETKSPIITILLTAYVCFILAERVYTKKHTVDQVIAGALLGGLLGYMAK